MDIPVWLVEALVIIAMAFIVVPAVIKFVKCCEGDRDAD